MDIIKKPYLDYFIGRVTVQLIYLLQIGPIKIAEAFGLPSPFYYGSSWLWVGLTGTERRKRLPYTTVMIDTDPKEAKKWIHENLNLTPKIYFSHMHRCFDFYYKEDAVAFKLRSS